MNRAFLSSSLGLLLAACTQAPTPTEFAPTSVNYEVPAVSAAATTGIATSEVPSFKALVHVRSGTRTVLARILPKGSDPEGLEPGVRHGTVQELLAFAVQHPDLFKNRIGVCARGTSVLTVGNPRPAFPVLSRRNGLYNAGLWSESCNWFLVVKTNEPATV